MPHSRSAGTDDARAGVGALGIEQLGRFAEAKEALNRALTLSAAFSGAEDAKAVLATLK